MKLGVTSSDLTIEDWSSLHAKLLWCYEGDITAPNRRVLFWRNQLVAWWLLSGSVTITGNGQTHTAYAGDWLFCGPQSLQQEFSADARILSIRFKLAWPSGDSLIDQILRVSAADYPELSRAARPLVRFVAKKFPNAGIDLHHCQADLPSFLELQKLFSIWTQTYLNTLLSLNVMPTRMAGLDRRVLAALRRLDKHDWHTPFNATQLAQEMGLSTGHFDSLFVQQLGLTPRAYLQKRRLEIATTALADPAVPAKKIAYDLGFSSPPHFTHWLRHATGKSPREFRPARKK